MTWGYYRIYRLLQIFAFFLWWFAFFGVLLCFICTTIGVDIDCRIDFENWHVSWQFFKVFKKFFLIVFRSLFYKVLKLWALKANFFLCKRIILSTGTIAKFVIELKYVFSLIIRTHKAIQYPGAFRLWSVFNFISVFLSKIYHKVVEKVGREWFSER